MRVALGADHAGVGVKAEVRRLLDELRIPYEDFGAHNEDSVDYPDLAESVARAVSRGEFDRGILVCGTGIGMAIAANKVHGIRAAAVNDLDSARLSREHNDVNVLALGARIVSQDGVAPIVRAFLDTAFEGGRHERRIRKIAALEESQSSDPADDAAARE